VRLTVLLQLRARASGRCWSTCCCTHPSRPAKDKLLQALTGWDKEITPNAIEVYISRLRNKLEPSGVVLRAIRGFGYRLELTPQAGAPAHDGD
jgi:hypothetical protein